MVDDFQTLLDWPKTPIRKNKRNTQKTSFIITSTSWKNAETEAKEKKKKVEDEKNCRKLARLAKKEQQIKDKEMKKNERLKKKVLYLKSKTQENNSELPTNSESALEQNSFGVAISNEAECTALGDLYKDGLYLNISEKTPTKKINILSNIVIDNKVDMCKKRVFLDCDTHFLKANYVTTGLCYYCTFNITISKPGLRCTKCYGRQYHLKCLQDKNENFENFVCRSCSSI